MVTRRFFRISVALAVLCVIPAAPAFAAHGGGGGGGGGGSGGGGGMMAAAAMHSSRWRRRAFQLRSNFAQHSGNWSQGNFIHSGNPNWSPGPAFAELPIVASSQWRRELGASRLGSLLPWSIIGGRDGMGWGWGWGWGYPFWFSYWGGYPFGWGGYYADYFCPYGSVYATGYPAAAYSYSYPDDGQYAANYAPQPRRSRPTSPNLRPTMARQRQTRVFSITTKPGLHSPGAIIAMHCGWPATREWNRRKTRRSTS